MDTLMARPKRNSQKKWDPDFVSPGHSNPHQQQTKKNKSLSLSKKKNHGLSKIKVKANTKRFKNNDSFEDSNTSLYLNIQNKNKKLCEKFGCQEVNCEVKCFAKSAEKCPKDTGAVSSRWYHISCAEHYCNECFDLYYRSTKSGNFTYTEWKKVWTNSCSREANIKLFFTDILLPYWVQCIDCNKWREVPADMEVDETFIDKFTCSYDSLNVCDLPESKVVEIAKTCDVSLLSIPLLTKTPIAPFLINYFADKVNMSPTASLFKSASLNLLKANSDENNDENDEVQTCFPAVEGVPSYFQPFTQPQMLGHARSFPPHTMTSKELEEFPQFVKNPYIYLILRNTALVLWTLNPKTLLTPEACCRHIICRGLVRIRSIVELPNILFYLSLKGFINSGVLNGSIKRKMNQKRIVIVGAGVAGLAAARLLKNFEYEVIVLEARDTIGGRIRDFDMLGLCISKSAQVINGCTNNPLTLICHQAGIRLIVLNDTCTLIDETGHIVNSQSTANMELHFNALLDNIDMWRKQKLRKDICILEKLNEMHQEFIEESQMSFTEEEESLLSFNMRLMESVSGTSLQNMSVLNFDHNEKFGQFVGAWSMAPNGFLHILNHLAKDIDVRLNTSVSSIDYANNGAKITTFGGTELHCDYVIITVPLVSLKKEIIKFNPPLSSSKLAAIQKMGVGQMEKLILKFENRFWMKRFRGWDSFGCVSKSHKDNLFLIFHDLTARIPLKEKPFGILITTLCGDSLKKIKSLSDREIVTKCVDQLRKYFPEENIADPVDYVMTHWSDDVNSGMCFSYLPIDSNASIIRDIAEPILNKIYFAGEATNEEHPQTVAGAYLSGIRDAGSIIKHIHQSTI